MMRRQQRLRGQQQPQRIRQNNNKLPLRPNAGTSRFLVIGLLVVVGGSFIYNLTFINHLDNDLQQQQQQQGRILSQKLQQSTPIDASIVIQLSGEMGNNLSKIAMGRAIQLMALKEFELQTNLILRHQEDNQKWKLAKRDITKCFPNLRKMNFEAANSAKFEEKLMEQNLLYGNQNVTKLKLIESGNDTAFVTGNREKSTTSSDVLKLLSELVQYGGQGGKPDNHPQEDTVTSEMNNDQMIHLPFLFVDSMINMELMDKYRDDFIEFFQFNDQKCCLELPQPNESVFHFRNFQTELKGATTSLGFTELGPTKVANEMLGHLPPKSKVAITTRFDNTVTQRYVKAMEANGLDVRVISGQSGVQDFCFLKHTQKELVGMKKSSYFKWAAYLMPPTSSVETTKIRTYSLRADSRHSDNEEYEWKYHPELQNRFTHRVFDTA